MMSNEEIEADMLLRLTELEEARAAERALELRYKQAQEEWVKEHADLLQLRENCRAQLEVLRTIITENARELYSRTQLKRFAGGVGIRIIPRLEYLDDEALAWCKQHDMFLDFDKKLFEKFSKEHETIAMIRKEIVQVTIPQELHLADAQVPSLQVVAAHPSESGAAIDAAAGGSAQNPPQDSAFAPSCEHKEG